MEKEIILRQCIYLEALLPMGTSPFGPCRWFYYSDFNKLNEYTRLHSELKNILLEQDFDRNIKSSAEELPDIGGKRSIDKLVEQIAGIPEGIGLIILIAFLPFSLIWYLTFTRHVRGIEANVKRANEIYKSIVQALLDKTVA